MCNVFPKNFQVWITWTANNEDRKFLDKQALDLQCELTGNTVG